MPNRQLSPDNTAQVTAPPASRVCCRHPGGNNVTRAFTLIELLVVIGIIALLVGILLPALASARGSTMIAVCASNQRQISTLWQLYLNDFDETFPVEERGSTLHWTYGGNEENIQYPNKLRPLADYTDDPSIFGCPADRPIENLLLGGYFTEQNDIVYNSYEYLGNSYMGNIYLLQVAFNATDRYLTGIRVPDIEVSPSILILAGDAQWYYAARSPAWFDADFHQRDNRINLTFLDGHVSFEQVGADAIQSGTHSWVFFKTVPERWEGYFSDEDE